jgi:DNA-directed RNA polymerase specialized sigma24 family protein
MPNYPQAMVQDTDIGGLQHRFPVTSQSAIVAARSQDHKVRQRAFETILASYWKPAYKYIRIKWQATNEDAKDLTQGFFANAFEKNHFATYDARKASFQTFLRTSLDGFIANQRKAERRLKRGGGADHFSLDFGSAEQELALHVLASDTTPEEFFHREWVRSLFTLAIETLREHCDQSGRNVHFKLFEIYDLGDHNSETSYSLAKKFDLSTITVNNYLAAVRRDFRKMLLEKLREITATEEEFRREARALVGVEIK